MKQFKNMVGYPLRITFENDIILYLKKNEKTFEINYKIKKIEKHILYSTLKYDDYFWEKIDFEIDNLNCIREKEHTTFYRKKC